MKHHAILTSSLVVLVLFLMGFASVQAPPAKAVYKADPGHSNVSFKIRHLGIANVIGRFHAFESMIEMDDDDLSTLQVSTTIEANSIDTGIDRRDNHLRSADFFEVETYENITFVSTAVRNIEGETFELVGDLTVKDVTREVVLEAEYLGSVVQRGTKRIAFEASTRIDRFDYNLKWDNLTEAGGLVAGREVRITLDIEAAQQ